MSQFKVYNASAGSGKTFTLVKEYLKVLLNTSDYFRFQNILAITFTNKAAAEMKNRVLENLKLYSEKNSNDMLVKITDELSMSSETIFNKSAIILNNIIQNYAGFNIMTIDSFTYRIIRNFAFDLGLSLNFDVELDVDKILSEAVDIVISKIGSDKILTKTLINYSIQKVDNDKSWDITNDLKSFASILFNENDINNVKTIQDKNLEDFINLKNKLFDEQKEVEKHLKKIGLNGLDVINSSGLAHNDFYRSMLPNHFAKLSENFEKASFFDQSKLRERIEENKLYANSKSSEVKNTIENILPELLELYFYSEQLFQKHTLNSLVLNSIIPLAVLNYINQTLSEIKENNNIRLNAEFNKLIFDKIKDEPAPFIYERLGEKYRYYFIDEMQDTSVLQWENIIPLIDNALVSEFNGNQKGSLLLVGDAKQSIYRWRGGKAEQFIKLTSDDSSKSNNPFQVKKEVNYLETNYRSFSEIINFNNQFFNHVSNFFQNDLYKFLYNESNQQKENSKKGGFVQINFVDKNEEEEEKELIYPKKVLEIIKNLDVGFNRSEVCVLVRTNKQGVAVANYLSENKIKIVSSETLLLKNNPSVSFIINTLSIIVYPNDKQFKIAALYFLYDILQIKKEKHLFFKDLINLETDNFFNHLKKYNINFQPIFFSKYSFYDGVEYLIRSFNLTKSADAYLQFFLDFVLESHKKNGNSIVKFLEHWESKKDKESIIASEQEDAVKITTIHKAKGLEFPIVIFPYDLDIYKQINPKIWYNQLPDEEFLNFKNVLINYGKNLQYLSDYGMEIYQQRREELELDNINLLYVTLTRAIEQLYIITEKKINKDGNENTSLFSGLFINYLKELTNENTWDEDKNVYQFGSSAKSKIQHDYSKKEKTLKQQEIISTSLESHNISIVTKSSLLWDTEQGKAIDYGNLIHEILSKIITKNDVDDALEEYFLEGLFDDKELLKIKKQVLSVVYHPKLKDYFQQNLLVFNEREISTDQQVIIIPDRLIIDNQNTATIIDYKTGKPKKSHHSQLVNYGEIIRKMGYKINKRILVYINEDILIDEVY